MSSEQKHWCREEEGKCFYPHPLEITIGVGQVSREWLQHVKKDRLLRGSLQVACADRSDDFVFLIYNRNTRHLLQRAVKGKPSRSNELPSYVVKHLLEGGQGLLFHRHRNEGLVAGSPEVINLEFSMGNLAHVSVQELEHARLRH